MTNMTFSIDEDLYKRKKAHPEIKWTEILRQSLLKFLNTLEGSDITTVEEFRANFTPEILNKVKQMDNNREDEIQESIQKSKKRRMTHLQNLERGLEE